MQEVNALLVTIHLSEIYTIKPTKW